MLRQGVRFAAIPSKGQGDMTETSLDHTCVFKQPAQVKQLARVVMAEDATSKELPPFQVEISISYSE